MDCISSRFLSTLPARGATPVKAYPADFIEFLSTLPARGATHGPAAQTGGPAHFYPRSPRGERPALFGAVFAAHQFLSTLPARGATILQSVAYTPIQFLSTLPVRGATPTRRQMFPDQIISIHAPREGSDQTRFDFYHPMLAFLSTLPVRGATKEKQRQTSPSTFLSTLPARGATITGRLHGHNVLFLSTLPARGATALKGELAFLAKAFLSTLPARGATARKDSKMLCISISIHAPREGSDPKRS